MAKSPHARSLSLTRRRFLKAGLAGTAAVAWVRVFNERGSVEVRARVENFVRDGVVALPHGWWASLMPGGSSANALTPDGLSDLGGGGDFHDARVEVERSRAIS